ncbi:MAG: phosphatidylserine/phosphatidylglycerophosphate/cardiolipin synthase family protein [Turneriella sp.]|nr:phosphatidylserine/phosphatidylglycerophosphate/cardiolipin synthase family protein [Turneriella sp.]
MQVYRIITEGDRYYARLLRAMAQAKHSIYMMVYIWQNDAIGRMFRRALERKCRQGVEVIVVVDAVGSFALPSQFFTALEQHGAQIFMHHHFRALDWNWFRFLIRRNHRKIFIFDEKIAFTGGFNLMRECSRRLYGPRRWLDLAIETRHAGLVQELLQQFRDGCRRARRRIWAQRLLARSRNRAIVVSGKRTFHFAMSRYFKRRLRRARREIVICVPYFVPYGFYFRILRKKLHEGVRVEIILPRFFDVPFVGKVSFFLARKLLQHGAQVFLYQPRFSHSKFYLIDDYAATGSANYDYRSMVLNLDTLVFVRGENHRWQEFRNGLKTQSVQAKAQDLKTSFFVRLLLPWRWLF